MIAPVAVPHDRTSTLQALNCRLLQQSSDLIALLSASLRAGCFAVPVKIF
jgi:hypothetical protein